MTPLPASIEDFRIALADIRPRAGFKAEPPFHPGAGWWLEVDGLPLVYRAGRGFGLFSPEEDEPGLWLAAPAEAALALACRMPTLRAA